MTALGIPGIRYGWDHPLPLLGDFLFRSWHEEDVRVVDKKRGDGLPPAKGGLACLKNYDDPEKLSLLPDPACLIYVLTARGDLQMSVSEEDYGRLDVGDTVRVRYREGRFTGALQGKVVA